jgi:hypothetical protein
MRSTSRRFLAAILLTAAAGFALSQEASAPPPPPAPDVAAPVAELPQLPVAAVAPVPDPNAAAVNPAVTIDPSALAVAPAAEATGQVPEPEKLVVTTTTKRMTKKSSTKPVAKPAVEATDAFQSVPAPAAAGTADPSTFQGLTPPNASANAAPAKSVVPPPPAAKAAPLDRSSEAIPRKKLGIGSWILGTILVLALGSIAIRFLRKQRRSPTSIVDFTDIHPELKAAVIQRS